MFRRVVRLCVAFGLLVVATAMALRTPGIWHAHNGGEASHGHGRRGHSPDSHDHAANSVGHSNRDSHGTHQQTHHDHAHTHGGSSHSHDNGHMHSHGGQSHEMPGSAVSADPTWHMHFSLLGFEMTLTGPVPGRANQPAAKSVNDTRAQIAKSKPNPSERAAEASRIPTGQMPLAQADPSRAAVSLPVDRTAMRFLGIELGPLPCRVTLDAAAQNVRLELAAPLHGGLDAQRPATPPPRALRAA